MERDGSGRLVASTERELATGRAVTTRHGHAPLDLLEQVTDQVTCLSKTSATKGAIRQGQFFKLGTVLEGGGEDGSWSFAHLADILAQLDRKG